MNKFLVVVGAGFAALAACAPVTNRPAKTATINPVGFLATNQPSRVQGSAELRPSGDGQTRLLVRLSGLQAGTEHAAHIHVGSCVNGGLVVIGLPDLKADASGNAQIEHSFATGDLPVAAYVNVHQKSSADGVGGGIACGDIR